MMTEEHFEERMADLALTSGSDALMEEFPELYETLLKDVAADKKQAADEGDPEMVELCKERLRRMRALCIEEALFLVRLRAERIEEGMQQSEGN
jgi:hypothetical protein